MLWRVYLTLNIDKKKKKSNNKMKKRQAKNANKNLIRKIRM